MYYSICYLSKASEDLSKKELNDLFTFTANSNNDCEVTGILLHSIGRFFQVMEGNEQYLKKLFKKIQNDTRHSEIFELFNGRTAHPLFLKYSSKFNVVKSDDDLNNIEDYLTENKLHPTSDKIQRILQPFLLIGMNP